MASQPQPTHLPVVCPLCRTRMYARPDQVGGRLTCPDCGTICPVLPPAPPAAAPKRADPGEYGMRKAGTFGDPNAVRTTPAREKDTIPPDMGQRSRGPGESAPPKGSAPSSRKQPVLILVVCPLCHTRMHPPMSARGKRIRCPDCGTAVTVPTKVEAPKSATAPDLVQGQYDMGAAPEASSPSVDMLIRSQSVPPSPVLPEPPRWSMFSGVFFFPWQREARLRWLYITAGLLVANGVTLLAAGGAEVSFGGIVGAAALGVVVLFALLWSALLASACLLSVIRETAAGIDVIEEWPDIDWREWFWPFLYTVQVLGVTSALAYAVYWVLGQAGATEATASAVGGLLVILLFPVVLLSVIENGSALAFYSLPVLRSLWRLPHYWLLFHLETQALTWGWLLLGWAATGPLAAATVLLSAPYTAAIILIYARLLGRMAWHVGDLDEKISESREAGSSNP